MESISKDLKKIYLDRVYDMPSNAGTNMDYNVRKMRERFQEEFDEVWIKYNKGKATFKEWESALNKWLNSEII
tara:strand:- start:144 stop:362 length:219 start_codon:yes stop_codon:yes gene_type:complete